MEGRQILKRLKTALLRSENRPKIFYFLASVPLVVIAYFHMSEWASAIIVPFYGFLLLVLKKRKLFSYQEAKFVQKIFGLLVIIVSPFVHFALLPIFPWAIYYGTFNYAIHILGLFLVFFDVPTLKEAFGPVFLIVVPSMGSIISYRAESYFTPILPSFAILIVAILNAIGIKAVVDNLNANWVILYTPHGPVTYAILWACIGFESAFLFAVVLVILLFEAPGSKKTKMLWSAIGLLGTFILNVFRVVLIFVTEYFYTTGGSATVHNFAGYVLFLTWVTVFLYLYSRKRKNL